MVAYKQSDIKLSWEANDTENEFPKVCGYVKEGRGMYHCKLKLQCVIL